MVKIFLLGQTKDDRNSTPSDEEISYDRAAFKITNHWGIIQVYQSLSTAKWWQNPQITTRNCVIHYIMYKFGKYVIQKHMSTPNFNGFSGTIL